MKAFTQRWILDALILLEDALVTIGGGLILIFGEENKTHKMKPKVCVSLGTVSETETLTERILVPTRSVMGCGDNW